MSEIWFKKMYIGSHVKCPLFLFDFNETWSFSMDLCEILKYQISWKTVRWEPSSSMRTDGRTDGPTDRHDEANSRFSQFCECAWNLSVLYKDSVRTAQWTLSISVIKPICYCCIRQKSLFVLLSLQNTYVHWAKYRNSDCTTGDI